MSFLGAGSTGCASACAGAITVGERSALTAARGGEADGADVDGEGGERGTTVGMRVAIGRADGASEGTLADDEDAVCTETSPVGAEVGSTTGGVAVARRGS